MKAELIVLVPALFIGWFLGGLLEGENGEGGTTAKRQETGKSGRPHYVGSSNTPSPSVPVDSLQCREELERLRDRVDLHPMVRRALRDRVLRAWLEIEPEEALAFAEQQIRFMGRSSIGPELFRVWIDMDVEGARQALSVASPALVESCFIGACRKMGRKDPEATLRFIDSRQWMRAGAYGKSEVVEEIFRGWASRDPQAALLHAGKNESFLKPVYTSWAKIDPLAAWKAASISRDGEPFVGALQAMARYVLPSHPELMDELSANSLDDISRGWVAKDLGGAREFALSLPKESPIRPDLFREIAKSIATADPEGAIKLFQEGGGADESDYKNGGIFRQAFISLNTTNPERARALLQEIPRQHQTIALGGILTQEFASDSEKAILQSREFLNDPAIRDLVVPALERALSWGHGSGNHDLGDIVEAIPELRPQVKEYLFEGWARVAPESAASFLADEARQYAERGEVFKHGGLSEGIAELSLSRPEYTATWMQSLPPGDLQADVAVSLAANWGRFDREAAEGWVAELPAGEMKDKALKALNNPVDLLTFHEKQLLEEAKRKAKQD